jgi:hypothetical protein
MHGTEKTLSWRKMLFEAGRPTAPAWLDGPTKIKRKTLDAEIHNAIGKVSRKIAIKFFR